jgi:hypothetical protein
MSLHANDLQALDIMETRCVHTGCATARSEAETS